jgi:hypothetical protein
LTLYRAGATINLIGVSGVLVNDKLVMLIKERQKICKMQGILQNEKEGRKGTMYYLGERAITC